jgi:hypothetical protein
MSTPADFTTVSPSGSDSHWRVPAAVTNTLILSASLSERGRAAIFNHGVADMYITFGGAANITPSGATPNFDVKITSGTLYELPKPIWNGEVWGMWNAVGGWAMVSETGDND